MPEWSIGTVSKTVVLLWVPRVRIPVFPPTILITSKLQNNTQFYTKKVRLGVIYLYKKFLLRAETNSLFASLGRSPTGTRLFDTIISIPNYIDALSNMWHSSPKIHFKIRFVILLIITGYALFTAKIVIFVHRRLYDMFYLTSHEI